MCGCVYVRVMYIVCIYIYIYIYIKCIYIYIYIYNVYLRFSPSCVAYIHTYIVCYKAQVAYTLILLFRIGLHASDTHTSTYTVLLLPFIWQTTKLYFPWISLPTIIHRTRHCFSRHVAVYVVDNWIMTARGCKRLLQLRKQRDCDLPI